MSNNKQFSVSCTLLCIKIKESVKEKGCNGKENFLYYYILSLHHISICEIFFMDINNVTEFSKLIENKHIITARYVTLYIDIIYRVFRLEVCTCPWLSQNSSPTAGGIKFLSPDSGRVKTGLHSYRVGIEPYIFLQSQAGPDFFLSRKSTLGWDFIYLFL